MIHWYTGDTDPTLVENKSLKESHLEMMTALAELGALVSELKEKLDKR